MPTIKKKDFLLKETLTEKAPLEELVDSQGGEIGGSIPNLGTSQIQTGPYNVGAGEETEYVKGQSTTTDRAARYRQNLPWYATYSGGGTGRRLGETVTKKAVEEKIEDLVKKSKGRDLYEKGTDTDVKQIISIIQKGNLSDEQTKEIQKALQDTKTIKNI